MLWPRLQTTNSYRRSLTSCSMQCSGRVSRLRIWGSGVRITSGRANFPSKSITHAGASAREPPRLRGLLRRRPRSRGIRSDRPSSASRCHSLGNTRSACPESCPLRPSIAPRRRRGSLRRCHKPRTTGNFRSDHSLPPRYSGTRTSSRDRAEPAGPRRLPCASRRDSFLHPAQLAESQSADLPAHPRER
jgi:hypothetical protein